MDPASDSEIVFSPTRYPNPYPTAVKTAADDKTMRKLMMLIEGTYGIGIQASIQKYGYSEQRNHQLLNTFKQRGIDALIDRKRGPKSNHVRDEKVISQIIRLRFLDPEASAGVIAQKLRQTGLQVSVRSVERTITEYGLQKKLQLKIFRLYNAG